MSKTGNDSITTANNYRYVKRGNIIEASIFFYHCAYCGKTCDETYNNSDEARSAYLIHLYNNHRGQPTGVSQ